VRGGSWNNNANNLRCANRNNGDPTNSNDNNGFRCASSYPICGRSPGVHGCPAVPRRGPDRFPVLPVPSRGPFAGGRTSKRCSWPRRASPSGPVSSGRERYPRLGDSGDLDPLDVPPRPAESSGSRPWGGPWSMSSINRITRNCARDSKGHPGLPCTPLWPATCQFTQS